MSLHSIPTIHEDTASAPKRPSISRKDTIIIAVLVNSMLLALLFAFASQREEGEIVGTAPAVEQKEERVAIEPEINKGPVDELDQIIQEYVLKANEEQKIENAVPAARRATREKHLLIKIKKGDSLAKIAKTYGITVEDIIATNKLAADRLQIGQELYIPQGKQAEKGTEKMPPDAAVQEYYTLRSGDNPWKIARKFRLPFEALLELNQLNEESAKNLKPGDKIRIR